MVESPLEPPVAAPANKETLALPVHLEMMELTEKKAETETQERLDQMAMFCLQANPRRCA